MNPVRESCHPGSGHEDAGPAAGPASVADVDQDGEADSLGITLSRPESTGARVSAPGELALPDGEQAASAAPRATNRRSRLSIGVPPGKVRRGRDEGVTGRPSILGRVDGTAQRASGMPATSPIALQAARIPSDADITWHGGACTPHDDGVVMRTRCATLRRPISSHGGDQHDAVDHDHRTRARHRC